VTLFLLSPADLGLLAGIVLVAGFLCGLLFAAARRSC